MTPPGHDWTQSEETGVSSVTRTGTAITSEEAILSQSDLNIDDKRRSNPLTWKGQFSPQLVEAHLHAYAKPGDCVLDPFAGSGTVIFEGLRAGLNPVGVEINPAAVTLARLYCAAGVEESQRRHALANVSRVLEDLATSRFRTTGLFARIDGDANAGAIVPDLLTRFARPSLELDLAEALVVSSDARQGISWAGVMKQWRDLQTLVMSLPYKMPGPKVFLADARQLPVDDESVDLVFTSPPYINVFNYHQQYRTSIEAVGWNVLPIARSEIGSNRKFRGNRLITVAQYCLDMALCLLEVRRVIKRSGRAVFVIGRESNVRKTAFYNGEILRAIAQESAALTIAIHQERVFQNRFGVPIFEDILHFKLQEGSSGKVPERKALASARCIAKRVLQNARGGVTESAILSDIDDAIVQADDVEPSPLVDLEGQESLVSTLHVNHRRS